MVALPAWHSPAFGLSGQLAALTLLGKQLTGISQAWLIGAALRAGKPWGDAAAPGRPSKDLALLSGTWLTLLAGHGPCTLPESMVSGFRAAWLSRPGPTSCKAQGTLSQEASSVGRCGQGPTS